jgi:hypothetical protein
MTSGTVSRPYNVGILLLQSLFHQVPSEKGEDLKGVSHEILNVNIKSEAQQKKLKTVRGSYTDLGLSKKGPEKSRDTLPLKGLLICLIRKKWKWMVWTYRTLLVDKHLIGFKNISC